MKNVLEFAAWIAKKGEEDDKDLLVNDGKPFLFSAFSCHANAFARAGELRSQIASRTIQLWGRASRSAASRSLSKSWRA